MKSTKTNEKVKENNKSIDNTINSGKSRNQNMKIKNEISDISIKDESQKIEEKKEEEEDKEISEKDKMGQTATSSYSKLTTNDYGLGLIKECLSIHNYNINVNDRIQLFKTLILPINKDEIEKQYKQLPKLDIYTNSTNQSLIKNSYSCSNIFDKSTTFNNSNINQFDKNIYLEEINKINLEDFSKEYEKKLIKFKKNKNLLSPIMNDILDLTQYIENYQEKKGVYIIDNSKWDELMIKFKNKEKLEEDEENKINKKKKDDTQYLFDYGDKINDEDDKRIFDYINYIDIFNDLVIPNEARGKKYLYQDLYNDFYIKQNNHGIDIKEYEPNEEENENLYLPKNAIIKNFKLSDIIENMIENKYNNNNQNKKIKEGLNNLINIYEQKGKYYFIPIKMVLSGYPLSGKKTQSQLINEKYKRIKIYNPEKMLEDKIKEYKEYKAYIEQPERNASSKGKNKNKKDESKKEIEEKIKDFEPVLKILNPYLEYLNKVNKIKEKENKQKKEIEIEKEKEKEKEEKKEGEKKKGKKKKKNKNNEEEEKKNNITQDKKTQEKITQ